MQRLQEGWTESPAIPIFTEQIIVGDDLGVGVAPRNEFPSRFQSRVDKKPCNAALTFIVARERVAVGSPNAP